MPIIAQGAEAVLRREGSALLKERVRKGYRIAVLDSRLRNRRTELEARLLNEARRAGVATPQIKSVGGNLLEMEWIDGQKVRDAINKDNCRTVGQKIGTAIAKLHSYDVIHGDLTTSNMIIKGDGLYLIDFGLGFTSARAEDKAVDLYLLYHALESTHWTLLELVWPAVLDAYKRNFSQADKVIKALAALEKRGRYKQK